MLIVQSLTIAIYNVINKQVVIQMAVIPATAYTMVIGAIGTRNNMFYLVIYNATYIVYGCRRVVRIVVLALSNRIVPHTVCIMVDYRIFISIRCGTIYWILLRSEESYTYCNVLLSYLPTRIEFVTQLFRIWNSSYFQPDCWYGFVNTTTIISTLFIH